jgi:peptide chain release factor 1
MVVTCQDENRSIRTKRALRVLRSRMLDLKISNRRRRFRPHGAVRWARRTRERIRMQFQNRMTDHRIGLTLYKLESVIDGDLDEVIEELRLAEQEAKMKAI